ncbi:hypothetical protein HG536_0H02130 [Torulaspora globosa]|uniref:Sugar utilization regulatory protein IMP2 n=1 Tax=Torulaspora globosa TaxID=48254 RepID=A0A7G3ZMV2_9SACH|nr:uncharacterized protein HG536_0H02130 [Torulaspora globosa]QLL34838.1 hypothetical protein HG536_0H02130 [Torulaspora globosa]
MSLPGHKSILLTGTDGTQTRLNSGGVAKSEGSATGTGQGSGGVQFDSEQLARGRSRTKMRNGPGLNASTSRSRSRSRVSSIIAEEEFLKWTVLRRDPSMRLQPSQEDASTSELGSDASDEEDSGDEELSDEEQVTDVDNDVDIDEEFDYDQGMKVLPNFVVSLNEVLESSRPWIRQYVAANQGRETEGVQETSLAGGYRRAIELVSKGKGSTTTRSYILCADLTSESNYALTYVMGSLIGNGDTLYIVHWDNQHLSSAATALSENVASIKKHVMYMFDCVGAVIEDLDVVVLSLQHPFPKQLLTEMIYALQPIALCCSLSMILSSLQNFVCSVPTLVIRKKLKRSKKKGISE